MSGSAENTAQPVGARHRAGRGRAATAMSHTPYAGETGSPTEAQTLVAMSGDYEPAGMSHSALETFRDMMAAIDRADWERQTWAMLDGRDGNGSVLAAADEDS